MRNENRRKTMNSTGCKRFPSSTAVQISLPVVIHPDEVMRKKSLGASIELCAEAAGYELDKSLQSELGVDKAQFSRWLSGQEGIVWPKLEKLMDTCGNDAPVLWMAYQRGYDLHAMRKRESELERRNRELLEQLNALKTLLRQ
jgi:plasmid maintenance system antidote protein VapI